MDIFDRFFHLGSHVEERDRKAIARTSSGLIKLLHPDGECTKAELEEYLRFGIELRRRQPLLRSFPPRCHSCAKNRWPKLLHWTKMLRSPSAVV